MRWMVVLVLSVAALVGISAYNDARPKVAQSAYSRCAAFAAADMDCPYQEQK